MSQEYIKGKGAQFNTPNRYQKQLYSFDDFDGIDQEPDLSQNVQVFEEYPKKIVNKVSSPDVAMDYSLNPYQGCEHGCIYCYARQSHEYWGFSSGIDFEQKIMIKSDAAKLLKKQLDHPNWEVKPIVLSGNTDCYQPLERKYRLTRQLLEVMLEYKHPVSIITKNALVLRDIDILVELQKENLISVNISISSLNESLRQKLEPRTSTYKNRLKAIEQLSESEIPVNAMLAPIIPGLNAHEISDVVKAVSEAGATSCAYIMARLNGPIGELFLDWLHKTYPNKVNKVIHQIKAAHGGQLNDSRFGTRMKGKGVFADQTKRLFEISKLKWFKGKGMPKLNTKAFRRPSDQLSLW